MAPPLYADLGKDARDLFSKGYNSGFLKIDTTTKSGNLELRTNGDHNILTSKLFGGIDIKYKIPDLGLTLSEKWNTDNTFRTECTFDERFAKGLKIGCEGSFAPTIGKRTAKVKTEFRHDSVTVNGDLVVDSTGGPILHGAAVFKYQPWLFGYYAGFDVANSKLIRSNLSLGYEDNNFAFHTFVNDNKDFGGSAYHRVSDNVELGASLGWVLGEQNTRFGLACKYRFDENTTMKGKINNQSMLALAVGHMLKPGIKAVASTHLNLASLNDGSHKVGFGLEFESPPTKI